MCGVEAGDDRCSLPPRLWRMLLCYTILTSLVEPHAPQRQELAISVGASYRDQTGSTHSRPAAHVDQDKGGLPPLLGAGDSGGLKEERLRWLSPRGSGGLLCPTLDPLPTLRGGVSSIPLPASPAATTPDLGYTEGPLLALKGRCVPLPARPPLLPAARTHSRAHGWTPRHTRPPSRNAQCCPPCLGDASACLCAPNPGLEPQGQSLCLCQLELLECSKRQNYSPADRQRPTPWDSPGRPRAVLVPILGPGFPRKAPWEPGCPPWGCPPPGSTPEWKGPFVLRVWRLRVAPGLLSRVGLASHTRPRGWGGGDAHMRLLGGILRPSRNQVTCGRGKLEMRGARMTAASPWETLWCFSPSSKLPMSAGGKSTRRGQRQEVSNPDCPAPGWGAVGAQGNCGADTGWPPGTATAFGPPHAAPSPPPSRRRAPLGAFGLYIHLRLYVRESMDSFNNQETSVIISKSLQWKKINTF